MTLADESPLYDLVIIGGGSGNTIVGHEFSHLKTAMVEVGRLGGTCLNVGCIPSKMLVLPATRIREIEDASRINVNASTGTVDWPALQQRVFNRVDAIVKDGTTYRKTQEFVDYYAGHAQALGTETHNGSLYYRFSVALNELVDDKAVSQHGSILPNQIVEILAKQVVIAAGARPTIPTIPGIESVQVHTSDDLIRTDDLPESLIILGGGFIAAEFGHVFSAAGVDVTIVHRGPTLLSHNDATIATVFTEAFSQHVNVMLNSKVDEISSVNGKTEVRIGDTVVTADALMVATGRRPNSDQLGLESIGVEVDFDGYVTTNNRLETTAPGVWALGDIRNRHQLKHLANQEARVIRHNLMNPENPLEINQRVTPHAVFSYPQIGAVGATEQELQANGTTYVAGVRGYDGVAYGWALEDSAGFAKVLIDPETLEILGGHILGDQAATLMQLIVTAMEFNIPADRFAEQQIWAHPALTEVVENAVLDALSAARKWRRLQASSH